MAKEKNYINNKTFYEVIVEHKKKTERSISEGLSPPVIPNYIGEAIFLICNKLITKSNFSAYSPQWKQEMLSDAMVDCVAAIDNFNPEKSNNPFAYFTQIAWYAFIRRITKEKVQTYTKHKNFENSFLMNELWEESDNIHLKQNEYSFEIVKSFEDKLTNTKKKCKMKKINELEEF